MPGYQPVRIVQPSSFYQKSEPIYGQIKNKKKSKGAHPLFEDLKARNLKEKMEYEQYLRNKNVIRTDPNGHSFNSLKLLGSCNDISYLDNFMSMPRQRQQNVPNENEVCNRRSLAKSSTAIFGKGEKRNSIHTDSTAITAAMFTSLRNSSSEDNLYESMEMIHYLKTMQSLNRQKKTRSIQKTGHPLFDSLREEQALREPCRKIGTTKKPFDDHAAPSLKSTESSTSDGNSPSSSSGDEYDLYPQMAVRTSKNTCQKSLNPHRRYSEQMHNLQKRQDKQKVLQKKKMSECNNGSESDEDFKIIPRPKFFGRGFLSSQQKPQQQQRRRSTASTPSDESDSSFHSGVLR